jgi:hypothetical protein
VGQIADLNELTLVAIDDYLLISDTSDGADKNKKIKSSVFPLKAGTPVAGRMAYWPTTDQLSDAGFAASDVARLSVAQTFSALDTFTAGLRFAAGQQTMSVFQEVIPTLSFRGTSGTNPTTSTQQGKYQRNTGCVYINAYMASGAGGGTGALEVVLPVAGFGTSSNQVLNGMFYTTAIAAWRPLMLLIPNLSANGACYDGVTGAPIACGGGLAGLQVMFGGIYFVN